MAGAMLSASIQRMGQALTRNDEAHRSDAELLQHYVKTQHQASFAALMRRHGGTVFAVCLRMLRHRQDAEDATQAVFLVLMRRAESIRNPEIASWLHGVAVRVCMAARKSARRRVALPLNHDPLAKEIASIDCDVASILDEELAALPGKYRSAMIECDVLERSRSEAAKLLGWPEGTVATRLAKARQLLADKLRQRGVTLGVTALSLLLGSTRFSVAMPRLWDVPTTSTHLLANGVLRTMSYSTLIWRSVAGLLLLSSLGTAVLLAPASDTPVSVSDSAVSAAPLPTDKPMVWKQREPIVLNNWQAGSLAFSPDGKSLLVGGSAGHSATIDMKSNKIEQNAKLGKGFVAVAYGPTNDEFAIASESGISYHFKHLDGKPGIQTQDAEEFPLGVAILPTTQKADPRGNKVTRSIAVSNARNYRIFRNSWIETKTSTQTAGGHETNYMIDYDGPMHVQVDPETGMPKELAPLRRKTFDPYDVPMAYNSDFGYLIQSQFIDRKTKQFRVGIMPFNEDRGITNLKGHPAVVVSAAWSKDGGTIVTGDAEGTIIVWDTKTYKETQRFNLEKQRICSVDLTKDGKRIAVATISNDKAKHTENIYVWDVANPPKTFTPIAKPTEKEQAFAGVASIKFTPDGKTLAACFCNLEHAKLGGTVRIWDLKPTGQEH